MFTGIVEAAVPIVACSGGRQGLRLALDVGEAATTLRIGSSLAVDGCCLTVVAKEHTRMEFDLVPETLERTTFLERKVGERVNIERGLAVGDRLDGHIVTGHVDAVGSLRSAIERGSEWRMSFDVPQDARRFLVEKGSITIQGVSLTIAALTADGCEVAVIPHTRAITTLGAMRVGQRVHLEMDALARWVARLLEAGVVPRG